RQGLDLRPRRTRSARPGPLLHRPRRAAAGRLLRLRPDQAGARPGAGPMTMNTRTRVAITAASAAALGDAEYGRTWSVMEPGPGDIWRWAILASYVLAIVAVALVDRWWALLPVLAPIASDFYIQNFTDYVYPWESE